MMKKSKAVLESILLDIHDFQFYIRNKWAAAPSTFDDNMRERVLLNNSGDKTHIPDLFGYKHFYWFHTLYDHPLYYNWLTFMPCDYMDRDYLFYTIEVLNTQLNDIWGSDSITTSFWLYKDLKEMLRRIELIIPYLY